jgi:hypothetical protein
LVFEVEKVGIDENGEEAEFEWLRGRKGDGGEGSFKGGQAGEEEGLERVSKKLKRGVVRDGVEGVARDAQGVEDGVMPWKEQVQNMSKKEFEAFLREKSDGITNLAADRVLDEVVNRVMSEEEEDGQFQKEVLGDGVMLGGDMEVEVGDRVREAASVSEAIKVQVRASPRLQRSKDEHILVKAEERVARKNIEFSAGNPWSTYLLSVNKYLALDCLQQIGINLEFLV